MTATTVAPAQAVSDSSTEVSDISFDHKTVHCITGPRSGLQIIVAVHDTTLGPSLGGCRVWHYPTWAEALHDALRLSRGMTYKNALAGLALGGGKSVIRLPQAAALTGDDRRNAFLDLGGAVEDLGGRYITAEDVGTSCDDMSVVHEQTSHVVGLPESAGGKGDPGRFTARGVHSAIIETLRRLTGSENPQGRRLTIVGLGQVGWSLAEQLANEGAVLSVADINPAKREAAEKIGATWVSAGEAHRVDADVLVPAGVGGYLTDRVICELGTAAVCGPANNQLARPEGAERLKEKGVLYAPDYLVNAGGVIYLGSDAPREQLMNHIDRIGAELATIYDVADERNITTVSAADQIVMERLGR